MRADPEKPKHYVPSFIEVSTWGLNGTGRKNGRELFLKKEEGGDGIVFYIV